MNFFENFEKGTSTNYEGHTMQLTQINMSMPSPKGRMELVTVTPDLARLWLSRNTRNRRLNPVAVKKFADEMRAGLFRPATSMTIALDWNGVLQNGQHRLAAQVETGLTFDMWVMFDADPDDFQVIDIGGSGQRTQAQVLGLAGVPNASTLRTIAHSVLRMRNNNQRIWDDKNSVASAILNQFVMDHEPELNKASIIGHLIERNTTIPRRQFGAVAFFVEAASVNGIEVWEQWAEDVRSGVLLNDTSSAYALRRWATNWRRSSKTVLNSQTAVAVISKAWNLHVEGRSLKHLGWRSSGPMAELPMPLPLPSPR